MNKMNHLNRREFMKTAAGVTVAAAAGCSTAKTKPVKSFNKKPNIIVVMSDEHNANIMGCYGNQIIRTPNLDRLAEQGITLESAYCNSPLCVPSRLSFTSGKYASRVGAWNNGCWLPNDEYPSLPRILNNSGYESFLCGKQHYDGMRRYGFTEIGGNMNKSRKTGRGGRRKADDLKPKPGLSNRFDNFHPGDSNVLKHDRNVTAGVLEFLQKRRVEDKPFFLFAGYLAPHFPLIVPKSYWDNYKGKIALPKIPPDHLESQPLNYKHLRIGFNVEDTPDEIVRKGRELYYGLTEWLDVELGKVFRALAESEVADNTVIIYTTDHGENMGEHGLWWKNCMYDHAARVPLVVSWPARWKGEQRRTEACSLVDVVQMIAELAGTQTPEDWNGKSMVSWLDDPKTNWKDSAVSEYYAHYITSGFAMLRQGQYKYVYHTPPDDQHSSEQELYDLKTDPGEFNNLAKKAKYRDRLQTMHKTLVKELGEHPDETEQRCRSDYARGYKGRTDVKKKKNKKKSEI